MKLSTYQAPQPNSMLALLLLSIIGMSVAHAATLPLSIKSAVYNKRSANLIVKTHVKDPGGLLTLLHSKGGVLGQTSFSDHTFTIPLAQLGDVPCQVEARLGELKVSKVVAGAGAECSKVPTCKILPFAKGTKPEFNKPFTFEAQVAIKDKKAAPLTIEWDFAGGVLGHPYEKLLKPDTGKPILSGKVSQPATFIKDNSRYHVRFAASDTLGRRCEASVDVVIGQLPNDLPDIKPLAEAAQQSAPARASGLSGETVVVPFEKRSMQCGHEAELMPPTYMVAPPNYNTINAYVYQKGLRPVLLGDDKIDMTYAAASNAADPVGANSINSTSQSWPIGEPNISASLKKGELFERYQRPLNQQAEGYYSLSLIDVMSGGGIYHESEAWHAPVADEGAYFLSLDANYYNYAISSVNADHGRYMPGKDDPYGVNQPQAFSEYSTDNNWFSAYWLPLTDIDDSGRVNPTTLMRVQAVDKDSQTPLASTDVTVTSGKDFHCRECHALDKIGANSAIKRNNGIVDSELMLMPAASNSVEDQEKSALQNMGSLHWFNDEQKMMDMGNMQPGKLVGGDIPSHGCAAQGMCHGGGPTEFLPDQNQIPNNYSRNSAGSASVAMHRLHGSLQYNADKSDILRDENGRYLCFGTDKSACSDPSKSLFPVKDASGKILPMEENCLKCHSGQREQCYRDRMFTAGVTCYQCHGDMLAVGQAYPKSRIHPDGNAYRMHWLDQPDCASCHTGSGNVGKDASKGYFSAGVKTLAFAEDDRSATPNAVDLANPDQRRFAVPLTEVNPGSTNNGDYNTVLRTTLYRLGKDAHGKVACAACHGPAHGIWPNRDPNANDNVTSLELQGHTGSLLECNACHKPDSFAEFKNIDDGGKVADAKLYVLGGPHSLHPINDPYWWKAANGDSPNTDGSTSGGWHNDYAKLPGKAGEDQCAACHGNDHKGTRLSKTPVDRVFDFSDVSPTEWALMKKAGFKSKVIKVAAGTPIGCNTCHTVKVSCNGQQGPLKAICGQPSEQTTRSSNQAPSLSPNIVDATIGEDFSQQLGLIDPEGDAVTSGLVNDNGEVTLDSNGMLAIYSYVIQGWTSTLGTPKDAFSPLPRPPFNYDIPVLLTDGLGAEVIRTLTIRMTCPDGMAWSQSGCGPLVIISYTPTGGMDAGPDWSYQVLAESGSQSPLSYSLMDPIPAGMSIDSQGKITWHTNQVPSSGDVPTSVKVLDSTGNEADLTFSMTVCRPPMHYNADAANCEGSVHITSISPTITSANQFNYLVTASDDGKQPYTFSLIDAPLGFSISPDGLITGDPSLTALGDQAQLGFTVQASTTADNWARQAVNVEVCSGTTPIVDPNSNGCVPGPISFTSVPGRPWANGLQDYRYQAAVTDSISSAIEFSLLGALPGMSIDNTGLVSWNTSGFGGQNISYGIVAKDANGGWGAQIVSFIICSDEAPIYNARRNRCGSPIQFTSTPVYGANADQLYRYQVTTSNSYNLPVTLSLIGAPSGMAIDGAGLISWMAPAQPDPAGYSFSIIATDSKGFTATQTVSLQFCLPPTNWDGTMGSCRGPLQITSTQPVQGIDVGQTFSYQVTAIDNDVNGGGITYSLSDSTVPSIAIDANTGLINWVAEDLSTLGGYAYFVINATDKLDQQEQQVVYLYTCVAPQHWSSTDGYCL